MRNIVLIQDKDYKGKIPLIEIKSIISKFKQYYEIYLGDKSKKVIGFELNGGQGFTSNGVKEWDIFEKWCSEHGLKVLYNTIDEVIIIRDNLREREVNINKN